MSDSPLSPPAPRTTAEAQSEYETLLARKLKWFEDAAAADREGFGLTDNSSIADCLGEIRHFAPPATHWALNIAIDRLKASSPAASLSGTPAPTMWFGCVECGYNPPASDRALGEMCARCGRDGYRFLAPKPLTAPAPTDRLEEIEAMIGVWLDEKGTHHAIRLYSPLTFCGIRHGRDFRRHAAFTMEYFRAFKLWNPCPVCAAHPLEAPANDQ